MVCFSRVAMRQEWISRGVCVNRERITNRRQLLESYLILHDFRIVHPRKTANLQLRRKADDQDYHLRVDLQWLQLTTDATVQSRLDTLGLVPFLQENGSAWIGVTATGQEVITHIERGART